MDCDSAMWHPLFNYVFVTPLFACAFIANIIMYIQIATVACQKSQRVHPSFGVTTGGPEAEKRNQPENLLFYKQAKITRTIGEYF